MILQQRQLLDGGGVTISLGRVGCLRIAGLTAGYLQFLAKRRHLLSRHITPVTRCRKFNLGLNLA